MSAWAPCRATGVIPKCSRTESVCSSGERTIGRVERPPHQVMRMDRGMRFMYASLVPSPFFRPVAPAGSSVPTAPHRRISFACCVVNGQLRSKDRGAFFAPLVVVVSCCYCSPISFPVSSARRYNALVGLLGAGRPQNLRSPAQVAVARQGRATLLGDDLW